MSETKKAAQNIADFFADLEAIRLSPDEGDGIATREILTRVPVRRPHRQEFVRCHPEPSMSLTVTIYADPDERDDVYFVAPVMRGVLAEDIRPVHLQLAINRKGVLFIWPLVVSGGEGLGRSWHESARSAAEIAKTRWIRIMPDRSLGGYRVRQAEGPLGEPEWPADKSFNELLTIAFGDRIITSEDHPVVRKLRGLT